jgi:hypothetical protein
MDKNLPLLSEEDIRTKVVTTWLADHGFGLADISIEASFEVRLGRGVFRVESGELVQTSSESAVFRPRADVLVRSCDGRNLLIVEAKAPDKSLDNEDREQGISYARLLREGGIAPFVILTNGRETQIYDSISGNLVSGIRVPFEHPHVKAGFRVCGDDLSLRSEALEALISLSPSNLIEFCRAQVSYRMQPLRSDDLFSGKKYIPALYVERPAARNDFVRLLDEERRRVVVVVGLPQVGKTNFICHLVEERIQQGMPCLFYPAVGMQKGLLQEISEDFEWFIGASSPTHHIVHKLTRILRRTGQRLIIFIDGWNEADQALARAIDYECERLSCEDVSLVISMTNVAAFRLLLDNAGNPSRVAEAASIGTTAVPLLEIDPEKKRNQDWSVVSIKKYSPEERSEAYQKYAEAFQVQETERHHHVDDPFLLRIGMELFQGQILPEVLEEPALIKQSIQMKVSRAVGLNADSASMFLSEFAYEMFLNDRPVGQRALAKRCGRSVAAEPPKGLFEAALLAKMHDDYGLPAFDFYYSRERDYIVACWARDWPRKLQESQEAIVSELSLAVSTQVGTEALRWFLRQPEYEKILRSGVESWACYSNPATRRVLLSTLWNIVNQREIENDSWIRNAMYQGVQDPNMLVRAEAAKLMAWLTEDSLELASIISEDKELVAGLLSVEEEYPIEYDIGYVVLSALRDLHWQSTHYDDQGSRVSETLIQLIEDRDSPIIYTSAVKALGFIAPDIFLSWLCSQLSSRLLSDEMKSACAKGIKLAIQELQERYYGSLCPGYLEVLVDEPERLKEEYLQMYQICMPVIVAFWPEESSKQLFDILVALQPDESLLDTERLPTSDKTALNDILARRYQLTLPFDILDVDTDED